MKHMSFKLMQPLIRILVFLFDFINSLKGTEISILLSLRDSSIFIGSLCSSKGSSLAFYFLRQSILETDTEFCPGFQKR